VAYFFTHSDARVLTLLLALLSCLSWPATVDCQVPSSFPFSIALQHVQILMELLNLAFGARQVQKDQQAHHKSHRAVFAGELDFLVKDSKRPGCVWAKYFRLDVGEDGEVLAERENLDVAAPQGTSAKEQARLERVRAVLELVNDAAVEEESDDEAAMVDGKDSTSADERAQRRRQHLLNDDAVPGGSLRSARAKRPRVGPPSCGDESGDSSDEATGEVAIGGRRPRSRARRSN